MEVPFLANIKSSEKDIRRSEARRQRNQAVRSEVRTHIRRFKALLKTRPAKPATVAQRAMVGRSARGTQGQHRGQV